MRQRIWLEVLTDYTPEILYREGKRTRKLNLEVMEYGQANAQLNTMSVKPTIYDEIREKQMSDEWLTKVRKMKEEGATTEFDINNSGTLKYKGIWCIHKDKDLKRKILEEAHNTPYSVHPGGYKIYNDLKQHFGGRT
ncbi:uncharacterized protein LOC110694282 [Chenopodium quinoa]|uniref:uncharacterized protein LOC110694282 n=1 Tax=Chenopodium quinoa TaxID=63459 RepID=UPI000B79ABBE|nr:uncharacterized protein LOC110694282 [Chenopodium quinoa]